MATNLAPDSSSVTAGHAAVPATGEVVIEAGRTEAN